MILPEIQPGQTDDFEIWVRRRGGDDASYHPLKDQLYGDEAQRFVGRRQADFLVGHFAPKMPGLEFVVVQVTQSYR